MLVVITSNDQNNGATTNGAANNSVRMCGDCEEGEVCVDGYCQLEGCEPQCEGATCGANGCGGLCGTCEGRESCVSGACELAPRDCTGFADAASEWTLPRLLVDDQLDRENGDSTECGNLSGRVVHRLIDLTGDGASDLVITDMCDSAGVGTTRWEVYENIGTGFAESPSTWTIPRLFSNDELDDLAGVSSDCGNRSGQVRYQVLDLAGDGLPDLVVTDMCDSAGVGTTRWEVYENTGSGFADTPTSWSIPQMFADDQLRTIAGRSSECGDLSGTMAHQLLDITGDGAPDLVVTDKCDSAGVGTTRWDVYENTGSGFAESPTSWALPPMFVDDQLDRVAGSSSECGNLSGRLNFQLLDLTGDGAPDLVLSDKCDSAGVGTDRWEVYENTGSGFATDPVPFALPKLFEDEQFDRTTGSSSKCGNGQASGQITHQLLDMDADGLVDLVLTDRCDSAGVGTTRWEYFRNQGDRFAPEPTNWAIPSMFADEQLASIAGSSTDCGGGNLSGNVTHTTFDLDGDGILELVLTDRCDSAGVGTTRWDVHRAQCE